MAMVRPEGLDELDELAALEDDELAGGAVVVAPWSSPPPPQAVRDAVRDEVRDTARASPAAYERGVRGVIFVTNPSLDSAF
jgi:hypothetical protein